MLDNVEADFNLVNSMIDTINAEANRLSSEAGLPPLLPPGSVPPDGAARLSERVTGVRSLMQRMCEELLVLDAEKRWGLQGAWATAIAAAQLLVRPKSSTFARVGLIK